MKDYLQARFTRYDNNGILLSQNISLNDLPHQSPSMSYIVNVALAKAQETLDLPHCGRCSTTGMTSAIA